MLIINVLGMAKFDFGKLETILEISTEIRQLQFFIMSSKESIFRLQDLLKQHCKQEHIEFTEYPNAKYVTPPPSVDKKVSTFFSKLFK